MSVKAAVTLWPGPDSYFTAPAIGLCNQSSDTQQSQDAALLLKQTYGSVHLKYKIQVLNTSKSVWCT